jgi:predicted nucleic-acid-binding protein
MLVLDTNVLVRIFAADDEDQTHRAIRLVESAGKKGEALLVPDLVLAETLWVLGSVRRLSRADLAAVAFSLLGDGRFHFENKERLVEAVGLYSEQAVDFTEAYAAATALELKARGVASFDQDLKKLPVKWVQP